MIVIDILNLIIDFISKKKLFNQSAALSFYSALSIAPMSLLFVFILSSFDPNSQEVFLSQIEFLFGKEGSTVISTLIKSSNKNVTIKSISGILGFVLLFVSSSAVFINFKYTLRLIFSSNDEESTVGNPIILFIKDRLAAILLIIIFILISIISFFFSSLSYFQYENTKVYIKVLTALFSVLIHSCLFSVIFHYLPHKLINKKESILGGSICAILFILGKFIISLYIANSDLNSIYGAFGSLIILLIWIYYSSFIIYLSASITKLAPSIKKMIKSK